MAHDWEFQPWDLRTVCKSCGLVQSNHTAGTNCIGKLPATTEPPEWKGETCEHEWLQRMASTDGSAYFDCDKCGSRKHRGPDKWGGKVKCSQCGLMVPACCSQSACAASAD